MGYFRELPNLLYQSFAPNKNSSMDYIEVKNIFRRVKLRDDLQNIFTIFEKFEIPDEHRPEIVAENYYGSAELDWVVLITANICLLYTSPSPRDRTRSRMPSSA